MTNALIPQDTINEIARRLDIVEIINEYLPLKKQGKNFSGLCPFHHEKTPSFVVSPEKQMFHCFGCGVGGNLFTFIMQKEGLNFPEAVERLALKAGVTINRRTVNSKEQKLLEQKERYYRIHEEAALYFQKKLFANEAESKRALSFLTNRALTKDIIQKFQLGFAPPKWDGLIKYFVQKGIKPQELSILGLTLPNKQGTGYYDRFRNRIMFPIWDSLGRVIAFGGRVLDNSTPKYLNSPDTLLYNKSKNLYALNLSKNNIRSQNLALIVEGYMDVIACYQYGIDNVVASLGTAFTNEQAKLLMRHTYQTAFLYDGDNAGTKATLRGLDILHQLGCDVKVVNMPKGNDPDDFLRVHGPEKLKELISQSQGLIEYKLDKLIENVDVITIFGKTKIIQSIAPDLLDIKSPVARSEAIKITSDKVGLSEASILTELKKYNRITIRNSKNVIEEPKHKTEKRIAANKIQVQLIRLLFEDNTLFEIINQEGGAGLFDEPVKSLYLQMEIAYKTKGKILATDLDERNSKILSGALLEEIPILTYSRMAADYIKIIKIKQFNREYAVKKQQLKEAAEKNDEALQVELLLQLESILQQKKLLAP